MKKAGVILMICQVAALISSCIAGDNLLERNFPNLLGFFAMGIVGVILYVKGSNREAKGKEQENQKTFEARETSSDSKDALEEADKQERLEDEKGL